MEEELRFRIDMAERHLVALQSFFPRIDAKVSAILFMSSAQIAVLGLNLKVEDLSKWPHMTLAAVFVALTIFVHVALYLCMYPSLKAGSRALSFFGHVARTSEFEFIEEYTECSPRTLLEDITKQIWRNSQIVDAKFRYLKWASVTLVISVLPWTILLILLSLSSGRLPQIS